MDIAKTAMAGTLESSDVQVTVEPNDNGVAIDLSSSVINQYGRQIKLVIKETLEALDVQNVKVTVVDKGALDCTIKARVECALYRAAGISDSDIDWGGVIRP